VSKVLRTIAKVATVVAAVAKFIPGVGQVVAAVATAVALVAGTLAQVTAKKPSAPGVSNQFVIDPQAGIPYCIGRTFAGGRIVHVDGYGGAENPYRSYVIAFSGGGQSDSIESVLIDRSPVSVGPGGASGYYAGFMWLSTQLGATPEAAALPAPFAGFPGWGASHKLSGYAAGLWTLKFDKKGKKFASGQPEFGVVGKWVKVYDPRLDSTFPGGSGPCRALQENTYVWSQNGPLHGLTWALGRWQNSKRALGVGIEAQDIDLQAFVDAANVFDANGWSVGGVMDGSGDKWNTLRTILWAGAAEPLDLGGLLSCRYESPKVSLATITGDDLADGDIVVPAMKTWRDRINSIIPRYRSEAHNWEIIPATAVRGTTYIAEDGEERTRESEYYCCQSLSQAAQIAAYEIALSREIDGITIPLKTKFIGYKPGDCLTLNIPEANLNNQPVVVTNRTLDPATAIVTMTFRTETAAKHAWALGRTSSAPPSPSITSSAVMDALIWNNRAGIPEERFNPLSTYDFGRIVNLANGARYIYVSDTPTAGNTPPDIAYWTELSSATAAVDANGNLPDGTNVANNLVSNRLTSIGSVACAIEGNSVRRLAGGADFNAVVRGEAMPGACIASLIVPPVGYAMLALDIDAAAKTVGGTLLSAFAYHNYGFWLYLNGGQIHFINEPAIAGKRVSLINEGAFYYAVIDGAKVGPPVPVPPNTARHWAKFYSYDSNVKNEGLEYGPYTDNAIAANLSALPLTPIEAGQNVVIIGNTIRNVTATNGTFSTAVRGSAFTGPCFVEAVVLAGAYTMVALDLEPTGSDAAVQKIMVQVIAGSAPYVYENGGGTLLADINPVAGDIVRIAVDGVRYKISCGGVQASYTPASPSNAIHWPKFWAYNTGVDVRGLNYGPFNNADFADIGGPTAPEPNATFGTDLNNPMTTGLLPVASANPALRNANLIVNNDGTAAYFNGAAWINIGAITLNGLGFTGDLNAERNSRITVADGVIDGIGAGDGAEVDNNIIVTLQEPPGRTFAADHTGALSPSTQLPTSFQFKLLRGAVDVSSTSPTTWTVLSQTGVSGGTVTVSNGVLVIPSGCGINTTAAVEISAVRGGVTRYGKINLSRQDAAAPTGGAGGGTTGTDATLNSVTGTTMVALSDEIAFKTGSGGVATFAGMLTITAEAAPNEGSFGAKLRWKIKTVGGSYSNVGAADIDENYDAFVSYDDILNGGTYFAEDGQINAAATKTGLATNTDHLAQLWGARDAATIAKAIGFGGGVSVTGS
jgi:hypothetical protein